MSGIEELVVSALEAYEAAKAIKEGVVTAWDDLQNAYSYISKFFTSSADSKGQYNDLVKVGQLWSMLWVHPLDMQKFLAVFNSANVSIDSERNLLFSSFHNLQSRPYWSWGFRFPVDVLLPLKGPSYRSDYLGLYTSLNSIALAIKYNLTKDLPAYVDNYNNYLNSLNKSLSFGLDFVNRESFETTYKLIWSRS